MYEGLWDLSGSIERLCNFCRKYYTYGRELRDGMEFQPMCKSCAKVRGYEKDVAGTSLFAVDTPK